MTRRKAFYRGRQGTVLCLLSELPHAPSSGKSDIPAGVQYHSDARQYDDMHPELWYKAAITDLIIMLREDGSAEVTQYDLETEIWIWGTHRDGSVWLRGRHDTLEMYQENGKIYVKEPGFCIHRMVE